MGKVVELDAAATEPRARARRGRRSSSKTALVLGGGGFTGGVYEIGALRALDLLAVNQTVNEFDVYVGTSAGAFIATMTANGVTPEEMMRVLNKRPSLADPGHRPRDAPAAQLPRLPARLGHLSRSKVAGVVRELIENLGESSAVDLATGLAAALPPGIYRGTGIERYVEEVLSDPDRTNDFRHLAAELYLTATDLDTTERVDPRGGRVAEVPISKAVAASGALPLDLRASRDPGPGVHRRRDPLDHEHRRRDRARCAASSWSSTPWCPTSTTSPAASRR